MKVAEEGNEHLDIFGKLQGAVKTNVWVLRVYETLGKIQTAMITVPKSWGIKDIACTDLLERKTDEKITIKRNAQKQVESVQALYAPNEIKTFLLFR